MEIRELRESFTGIGEVSGFVFELLFKDDGGYIYRVTSEEGSEHFEVFERKVNKRFNVVSYPRSNAFGVWAWTAKSLDRAFELLKRINNNRNNEE